MDREECWQVIDEQRLVAADLLESLTETELATRSWCPAWTVREIGAHLAVAASTPAIDVVRYLVRARGRFDPMITALTIDRAAARTDDLIIGELRALVGSRRLAPTTAVRDPLLDVLVHIQDMARPLGRSVAMPTDPAREAADWAWKRGAPFHPARRLSGVRLVADDTDWQQGSGAEVHGPIGSLLLLSTGRHGALAELTGPGVDVIAAGGSD